MQAMNNAPIGVLDSGVGGLSIWKEIVSQLPNESTIYVADSVNCPYGNKSSETIYRLAKRLVKFLILKKVKLIVLACNTITVSCLDKLREDFPNIPIVGTVPVVKTAAEKTQKKRIGILSTSATAKSRYQKDLIKKFALGCKVFNIGTDKLVPSIEQGEIGASMIRIIEAELQPFIKAEIDVLALGCSHFPFLKEKMQKILGNNVLILDSGAAIARQVKRILIANQAISSSKITKHRFYTTGDVRKFDIIARRLVGNTFLGGDIVITNILVYLE